MNEPTPDEAAAALRTIHDGRERVFKSAAGSRWLGMVSGLVVFLYCSAIDLFPSVSSWLTWPVLALVLVAVVALQTRVGSSLLGQPVILSSRSRPHTFTSRLLRIAPVLGLGIAALVLSLLHVPHAGIYFGALAGLYITFISPRFQLWQLRRTA